MTEHFGHEFALDGQSWSRAADRGRAIAEEFTATLVARMEAEILGNEADPDTRATMRLNALRRARQLLGDAE